MPSPPAVYPPSPSPDCGGGRGRGDGRPSAWSRQANFPSPPSCCYHGCHYARRRAATCQSSAPMQSGVFHGLRTGSPRFPSGSTDLEQYRLEQERIFKGPTWNFLCLAAEIAKPGDYVATTIGETAVIVTRDAEGEIN